LAVTLVSSDANEATAPGTVAIAAGFSSATFTISGVDESVQDYTQTVTITASAAGFSDGSETLDVLDDDGVSDAELVMQLTFDEPSGTTAADSSPNGDNNQGTLRGGASFAPVGGNFAGAVVLDGVDDYVSVADSVSINTNAYATRTVSVWFQVTDTSISDRKQVIFEEGGITRGLSIYVHDGLLYVGGWNTPESSWIGTFLSTSAIADGTWHHVALVLDATPGATTVQADAFRAYLDGGEFGSGDGSQLWTHGADIGLGAENGDVNFHDGAVSGTANHALAGSLDDVRVYNQALNASQIALLAGPSPLSLMLTVTTADLLIPEHGGTTTGIVNRSEPTTVLAVDRVLKDASGFRNVVPSTRVDDTFTSDELLERLAQVPIEDDQQDETKAVDAVFGSEETDLIDTLSWFNAKWRRGLLR
jgi:hypothetical protein